MLYYSILLLVLLESTSVRSASLSRNSGRYSPRGSTPGAFSDSMTFFDNTSTDRRIDRSQLKVSIFNAEWLFGSKCSESAKCLERWTSDERSIDHLNEVAAALAKIDTDVAVISEVFDLKVLWDLAYAVNALSGASYQAFLVDGTDKCLHMNVGLLSKIDLGGKNSFYRMDDLSPMDPADVSKSLVAKLHLLNSDGSRGERIAIIGVHLLSGALSMERCPKRLEQARRIRIEAKNLRKEKYMVIVAGDMNDFDVDIDLEKRQRTFICGTLPTIKDNGESPMINAMELYTTPEFEGGRPGSAAYSYTSEHGDKRDLRDHILLDQGLGLVAVTLHTNINASDHIPITATLRTEFDREFIPIEGGMFDNQFSVKSISPHGAGATFQSLSGKSMSPPVAPTCQKDLTRFQNLSGKSIFNKLNFSKPASPPVPSHSCERKGAPPPSCQSGSKRMKCSKIAI